MHLSLIYHRGLAILETITSNPLVYFPMIGAWLITEIYYILYCDEKHGQSAVMSTGIALMFTALVLAPASPRLLLSTLPQLRTLVILLLFFYGLFLVIFGLGQHLPGSLAEFFGAPGHSLVPGMMAILYIEQGIPFDRYTFGLILTPVLTLGTIKMYRRTTHRIKRWMKVKEE
jgi:hypothetical protein